MIFDLIRRENKNNLKCLIGDFKLVITGKDNLFFPSLIEKYAQCKT